MHRGPMPLSKKIIQTYGLNWSSHRSRERRLVRARIRGISAAREDVHPTCAVRNRLMKYRRGVSITVRCHISCRQVEVRGDGLEGEYVSDSANRTSGKQRVRPHEGTGL